MQVLRVPSGARTRSNTTRSPLNQAATLPYQQNAKEVKLNLEGHTSTDAETELEQILNSLGNGALRGEFQREWRVGDWAVDFYFAQIRLAIEVDGGYHRALSRWRKDLHKTRDLEASGITVLRLTNSEVLGDRERLVTRLRAAWRAAQERSRQQGSTSLHVREPDAPVYVVAASPARHCRLARPRARSHVAHLISSLA